MIPGKNYTPEELLAIAWRRKWLLVALTMVGAIGGYLLCRVLPVRYESEATIVALAQRVDISRMPVLGRPDDRVRNLVQDLKSRPRLEGVILEFNLYADLQKKGMTLDRIVDRMRKDIDVKVVGGDTVTIGYVADQPTTALAIAQRLVDLSLEATKDAPRDNLKVQRELLEKKIADARARLEAQEKRVEDYKRLYAAQLPEQRLSNQQILQTTQMQLQTLQDSLDHDRDRRNVMDREAADLVVAVSAPQVSAAPTAAASSPAADELDAARATLKELRARFTDEHPDVVAARRQVLILEARVPQDTPQAPATNPAAGRRRVDVERENRIRQVRTEIDVLDRQIAAKQAEVVTLRGRMGSIQRDLAETPSREAEMVGLTRDYETISQFYNTLISQREQTGMAQDTVDLPVNGQFRIVDPPRLPLRPVSPNVLQITAAGAMVGLILAAGLIGLIELRDSAFRTEDEVTAFIGLPVVAMIPLMGSADSAAAGPRLKRWLDPLSGNALADPMARR